MKIDIELEPFFVMATALCDVITNAVCPLEGMTWKWGDVECDFAYVSKINAEDLGETPLIMISPFTETENEAFQDDCQSVWDNGVMIRVLAKLTKPTTGRQLSEEQQIKSYMALMFWLKYHLRSDAVKYLGADDRFQRVTVERGELLDPEAATRSVFSAELIYVGRDCLDLEQGVCDDDD